MSTFLALAQKLRQNTIDSGTGPTTVVGQTGQLGRLTQWVIDAYCDLQNESDLWRWLRHAFTLNTTASDGIYAYSDCTDTDAGTAIARFSHWYRDSIKSYKQSDGVGNEAPLIWLEWERFRRLYRYGTQTNRQPVHVSQDPQGNLVLGPVPDAVYVVSGEFQRSPQILAADADVPEMPARFHDLIVYDALAKYGGNVVAAEALVRAQAEGGRLRSALERDQLPALTYGEALA